MPSISDAINKAMQLFGTDLLIDRDKFFIVLEDLVPYLEEDISFLKKLYSEDVGKIIIDSISSSNKIKKEELVSYLVSHEGFNNDWAEKFMGYFNTAVNAYVRCLKYSEPLGVSFITQRVTLSYDKYYNITDKISSDEVSDDYLATVVDESLGHYPLGSKVTIKIFKDTFFRDEFEFNFAWNYIQHSLLGPMHSIRNYYYSKFNNEHVGIKLYDSCFLQDGKIIFVAEYIEGITLDKYLKKSSLTRKEKNSIIFSIAGYLDVAHSYGMVHRNLSPEFVIIEEKDKSIKAKISDFYINALPVDKQDSIFTNRQCYSAPEVLDHKKGDARSDIFSFGKILFELYFEKCPDPCTKESAFSERDIAIMKNDKDKYKTLYHIICNKCCCMDAKKRVENINDLYLSILSLPHSLDNDI